MKQWMKYMTVACSFLVMAIVCFPNKGNQVSAEGTTSGNTVQTEEEGVMPAADGEEGTESDSNNQVTSWIVTVQYVIDDDAVWDVDETFEMKKEYEFKTQTPDVDSGAMFEVTIPEVKPNKKGYTFKNWKLTNSANEIIIEECTSGVKYDFSYTQYAGKTLTFTAVWTDSYEDVVTPDEGENEETDTESGFLAEGATPTNGENKLKANIKYILGSGTWTVNGTPTIYEGGSEFYVEADGTYTFSQISQSQ